MRHLPRHDLQARLRWANQKLGTISNLLRIDCVGPDRVIMLLGVQQYYGTLSDYESCQMAQEYRHMGNVLLDWECDDDPVIALGQLLMRTLYRERNRVD